jgi:hypothetical protein
MAGRAHNPWDAAAACETHAESTKDRKLKDRFRRLRDSWISIANDEQLTGDSARGQEKTPKGTDVSF